MPAFSCPVAEKRFGVSQQKLLLLLIHTQPTAFPWQIHFPGTDEHRPFAPYETAGDWGTQASHRVAWFPDLINKLNW